MIPFKLEYVIEHALQEQPSMEQIVLKKLTGVKLSKNEANVIWERILDHKWYISEQLGRDAGFRVAAVDYFENVHPNRFENKIVRIIESILGYGLLLLVKSSWQHS